MARKRAESMDQASFWAVNAAGAPGKRCRPTMASPRPGRMIGFAPFQGFIRGMSVEVSLERRFLANDLGRLFRQLHG